jgi:hypothetical protein
VLVLLNIEQYSEFRGKKKGVASKQESMGEFPTPLTATVNHNTHVDISSFFRRLLFTKEGKVAISAPRKDIKSISTLAGNCPRCFRNLNYTSIIVISHVINLMPWPSSVRHKLEPIPRNQFPMNPIYCGVAITPKATNQVSPGFLPRRSSKNHHSSFTSFLPLCESISQFA